jgi:hypothetical protein
VARIRNIDILDDRGPMILVQEYVFDDRTLPVFRKPAEEDQDGFSLSPGVEVDRTAYWIFDATLLNMAQDIADPEILERFALIYRREDVAPTHVPTIASGQPEAFRTPPSYTIRTPICTASRTTSSTATTWGRSRSRLSKRRSHRVSLSCTSCWVGEPVEGESRGLIVIEVGLTQFVHQPSDILGVVFGKHAAREHEFLDGIAHILKPRFLGDGVYDRSLVGRRKQRFGATRLDPGDERIDLFLLVLDPDEIHVDELRQQAVWLAGDARILRRRASNSPGVQAVLAGCGRVASARRVASFSSNWAMGAAGSTEGGCSACHRVPPYF